MLGNDLQKHLQRSAGGVAHAVESLLTLLQRSLFRPRSDIDVARDQQIEGSEEVYRRVRERHDYAVFFANAGDKIQLALLRPMPSSATSPPGRQRSNAI